MGAASMTAAPIALPDAPRSPGRIRQWLVSPVGAQVTALVVFVGLWQLVTLIAPRVPSPGEVTQFLYVEITGGSHGGIITGEFFEHFAITLRRFSLGLLIGFTGGLLIGIVIGMSGLARALLNDTVLVLLTMPAFVWAFLTTMWFGITWQAPVLTVAFTTFPFVAINVAQGARAIIPELRNMSSAFEVGRWKQFRHLIVPAVAGYIFAGLRFAIIVGWNPVVGVVQRPSRCRVPHPLLVRRQSVSGLCGMGHRLHRVHRRGRPRPAQSVAGTCIPLEGPDRGRGRPLPEIAGRSMKWPV
jgi:ABC-type nitrate/sulfonate/bicarbonate transport system permease component